MAHTLVALAFVLALFSQGSFGEKVECEDLKQESCAYAVSSTGKRCMLEKHVRRSGAEEYTCRESEIEADKVRDWIESDQCVEACGLDRSALGISSDSLIESLFARKICSHECYGSCPNIVDLYFNLAAGEGVYLPKFCEAQAKNTRREMAESAWTTEPEVPTNLFSSGPSIAPAPAPAIF